MLRNVQQANVPLEISRIRMVMKKLLFLKQIGNPIYLHQLAFQKRIHNTRGKEYKQLIFACLIILTFDFKLIIFFVCLFWTVFVTLGQSHKICLKGFGPTFWTWIWQLRPSSNWVQFSILTVQDTKGKLLLLEQIFFKIPINQAREVVQQGGACLACIQPRFNPRKSHMMPEHHQE